MATFGLWPTAEDLAWLIFGLLPFVMLLILYLRYGSRELTSLQSLFLVANWIGYSLTPWLGVATGGWEGFLLYKEYITDGIRYAVLASTTFMFGYAMTIHRICRPSTHSRQKLLFVNPKPIWVFLLSILVFALDIYYVGGLGELWSASVERGFGQFDEKNAADHIRQGTIILSYVAGFISGVFACLIIARGGKDRDIGVILMAWLSIIISSLYNFYYFSRGAGGYFIILALVLAFNRGRAGLIYAVGAFAAGLWLCWIGYTHRGLYLAGVGNFIAAAIGPDLDALLPAPSGSYSWFDPGMNPLNALDSWTARAWTRNSDMPGLVDGLVDFVSLLQPLPSFLFSLNYGAGTDLAIVFGTWGSTGLTVPALGELYYLLGYSGLTFVVLLGCLFGWVERRSTLSRDWSYRILWLACALSCVFGLHQGLRAMTRPIVYASLVWVGVRVYSLFNQSAGAMAISYRHRVRPE